jgi:hypothetical protein
MIMQSAALHGVLDFPLLPFSTVYRRFAPKQSSDQLRYCQQLVNVACADILTVVELLARHTVL